MNDIQQERLELRNGYQQFTTDNLFAKRLMEWVAAQAGYWGDVAADGISLPDAEIRVCQGRRQMAQALVDVPAVLYARLDAELEVKQRQFEENPPHASNSPNPLREPLNCSDDQALL